MSADFRKQNYLNYFIMKGKRERATELTDFQKVVSQTL